MSADFLSSHRSSTTSTFVNWDCMVLARVTSISQSWTDSATFCSILFPETWSRQWRTLPYSETKTRSWDTWKVGSKVNLIRRRLRTVLWKARLPGLRTPMLGLPQWTVIKPWQSAILAWNKPGIHTPQPNPVYPPSFPAWILKMACRCAMDSWSPQRNLTKLRKSRPRRFVSP